MKALVKHNMQIGLAREGLSKHLHNSITHILGVKNKEQMMPPPNDDPPSGSKMVIIASHGDGHKSAKDYISKVNLDAQSDNKQFIERIQLKSVNRDITEDVIVLTL